MPDEGQRSQVERWLNFAGTVIAPATVLSAVLFYFGYVSSRAQYQYFGIDVDTIGLSTQDYVMRSPQPLLVPLLVLVLLGAAGVMLHTAIRRRIATVVAGAGAGVAEAARIRLLAQRAVAGGLAVLTVGVLLLFAYPYLRDWAFYNLVTPLIIAVGALLIVYAWRVLDLARSTTAPAGPRTDPTGTIALRRSAAVLVGVVIVASVFWATATLAQWSGRGIAQYDARHLDRLPAVILDTQQRLYLTDGCRHAGNPQAPCIEETALPKAAGQTFLYRYRHFRLLIQGKDRLFLVPDVWSASNSTLIVPLDGTVRVQFQFQNQPP